MNLIDISDTILFEILYNNCESSVQESFDRSLSTIDIVPTYDELMEHIEMCARTEELRQDNNSLRQQSSTNTRSNQSTSRTYLTQPTPSTCFHCGQAHSIYQCESFRKLSPEDRYKCVRTASHCINCLRKHSSKECSSKGTCKHCRKRHHSMLHFFKPESSLASQSDHSCHSGMSNIKTCVTSTACDENVDSSQCFCVNESLSSSQKGILLSTVCCSVRASDGTLHTIRMLLDPGSESNLITAGLVAKLKLPVVRDTLTIQGVSKSTINSQGKVTLQLFSSSLAHTYQCCASILPVICDNLPSADVSPQVYNRVRKLQLADPQFYQKSPVDLLLGAQAYTELLSTENPSIIKGEPTAIKTMFGWVLLGGVPDSSNNTAVTLLTTNSSLEKSITQFWETESILTTPDQTSPEHDYCENLYQNTTQRNKEGRYIVSLPFKPGTKPDALENRSAALSCFYSLENRLLRSNEARHEFTNFMEDYIESQHMKVATSTSNYILPYHCVVKESTTTRTRVVFNASAQCRNKVSLNSLIYPGPNLQNNLPDLLITFRLHAVVLSCDVKAMFRQILLDEKHRKYQHIFYRPKDENKPKEFELQTVTYGFCCSPWLA